MKKINLLSLKSLAAITLGVIFLYSCSSKSVVSNGLIQKRKYQKGFYIPTANHRASKKDKIVKQEDIVKAPMLTANVIEQKKQQTDHKLLKHQLSDPAIANQAQPNKKALKKPVRQQSQVGTNNVLGNVTKVMQEDIQTQSPKQMYETDRVTHKNAVTSGAIGEVFGVISLILGIIGILLLWYAGGIVFDLLAILFALLSGDSSSGRIGLILGIIGAVLWLIIYLIVIVALGTSL